MKKLVSVVAIFAGIVTPTCLSSCNSETSQETIVSSFSFKDKITSSKLDNVNLKEKIKNAFENQIVSSAL